MKKSILRTTVLVKLDEHIMIPSGVYKLKIDEEEFEEFDEALFLMLVDKGPKRSRFRMNSVATH